MQGSTRQKNLQKRRQAAAARRAAAERQVATEQERWRARLAEPRVPIRAWTKPQQEAALQQLEACDDLSAERPPSCCMFSYPQAR